MKEVLKYIEFGDIKPSGWIKEQMHNDLVNGFVGRLDEIVPVLIKDDDIYGKNRLTKNFKVKNLGVAEQDVEGSLQLQWWNSETQSNWYDGFVRNTLLLENKEYMNKVKSYIDRMLSYQDENGYMGIYGEDLRYNFDFEGGELWAQSTLFRVLLAYYEVTKEERVLKAVIRAVDVTMKSYAKDESEPFKFEQTHGLTIIDTLETLYRLTNDEKYIDYAVWLYDDFSTHKVNEEDAQLNNLINEGYKFKSHGVHTYEHLRAVITASFAEKGSKYEDGLKCFLNKLDKCLSPSGGPIGDEWIAENHADASMTGYEYCSIQELLHAYSLLLQKSGDMKWADRIEWILFNAGQGARHPQEPSIAYLKSDNSYAMQGDFHFKQDYSIHSVQTRYKYSPAHQDAAVCCVPNAGRIYPYFVQSMWMKNNNGIVKALYGPSKVNTEINGVIVEIEEFTEYPFENNIKFVVNVSEPCNFDITLRKPSWCKEYKINGEGLIVTEENNTIVINKTWEETNVIEIEFRNDVEVNTDLLGDSYISYGPLVFALELEGNERVGKNYDIAELRDVYYDLKNTVPYELEVPSEEVKCFKVIRNKQSLNPWRNNLIMKAKMYNKEKDIIEDIELVPMGGTILRKVTFK